MKLLLHETRKLHEERNKKAVSVFERKMYNITKKIHRKTPKTKENGTIWSKNNRKRKQWLQAVSGGKMYD